MATTTPGPSPPLPLRQPGPLTISAAVVLDGAATRVAGALRQAATTAGLVPALRANADTAAAYLPNKRAFLKLPERPYPGLR